MRFPIPSRNWLYFIFFAVLFIIFIYIFTDELRIKTTHYIDFSSNSNVSNVIRIHTDNCNANRTLLIISGQVRDFIQVWNWTYVNLVLANEPCDIILSIHGTKADIPEVVLRGFGKHVTAILTTDTETPVGRTEFWMTARAIRKIQPERYAYVIKTRPDLFHRLPIKVKIVYADDVNFTRYLRNFHRNLTEKIGRNNFTVAETLYAWIMTSGLVELIPTMIMRTPISVWCKLAPADWNKNLRIGLQDFCHLAGLVMFNDAAGKEKEMVYILKMALAKFKVVYNIGATWVQYGPTEHMVPLSIKIHDEFGQHTWADVGYNDSDNMHTRQWRDVTESQMRLTHLKGGYNLIDIINDPDIEMTFRYTKTFRQTLSDNNTFFFIARSKERYMYHWNLTDPTKVEYW